MLFTKTKNQLLLGSATACILSALLYAPTAQAVVPNDSRTPDDIVDTEGGVNGVGMFFRNDGSVCTGSLINPRTVLFAAHCVNNRPESDYGTLVQSAFSFNVNALPGFQNWLANGFASNPDLNVFNVNQIYWNPDSTIRGGANFLEGDIALASLDTPAANIPTWALLFSRLPDPATIDPVNGTGYNVNITGYGASGSGTAGAFTGIDFRRRAAENVLGALTSFDARNTFLFGAAFGDLPQNLYRTDFDDPLAGAPGQNPFDFNLYRDEARENEGTTAGGDSGGPLILDAANNAITDEDLIIGTLSGGSRFFGGQAFSSFGTGSFYQPLFLFYEYIAANNPYRYVSAIGGDGAWEDAAHWQTDLDPNYRIIDASGAIVNGFPDEPQTGITATDDPGFGEVCFDTFGPGGQCQDLSTGDLTPPSRNLGDIGDAVGQLGEDELSRLGLGSDTLVVNTNDGALSGESTGSSESAGSGENTGGGALSGVEGVILGSENQASNGLGGVEFIEDAAQASDGNSLPAPTIANGLAGATDFVPDNIDPPSGVNGPRRYFDVTLANAGTTTLSSEVTIDRLTVRGDAGLAIGSGASLTSLIDISQYGGRLDVDGAINSVGDYTLFAGMLSGSGTVTTPFFTSIAGLISPGSIGTTGTLDIDGSAVLASGTNILIDIGANGVSDVLAITGDSSLGGQVNFLANADVRAGNSYTFLTTAGAQTGTFDDSIALSAILSTVLTFNENSVVATIEAGSYLDVVAAGNAVQNSYARLLNDGRGNGAIDGLFSVLDLATEAQIQTALDSWAPVTETTNQSLAKTTTETLSRFHNQRLNKMGTDNWGGGTVTVMGSPIQMASNAGFANSTSDVAFLEASNTPTRQTTNNIASEYAAYLSGTFINGQASAMPTAQNFANEDFSGWSVTAGLEQYVSEKFSVGASVSYTKLAAEASLNQRVESDHFAATLYGQLRTSSDLILDGQVSMGSFASETTRVVEVPQSNTLTTDDKSFVFTADVQLSKNFAFKEMVLKPKAGLRLANIDFDDVTETGGLPALNIERDNFRSVQGRVGAELSTPSESKAQLHVSGEFVYEFADIDQVFNANFVGAGPSRAPFALFGSDDNWFELGGGIGFDVGNANIDLSVDTTIGRSDVQIQTYRAGVSFKF